MSANVGQISTKIARHDLHHIWVRDHDLTADLVGTVPFADMVFLLIGQRLPDERERALVDAVLVTLVEHGLTPSAVVARMTYAVAPESLQGAVAAGLLGAGSVVLGSMEECGMLLTRIDDGINVGRERSEVIDEIVAEYRASGKRIPGVGHVIHTEGDPRAARLFEVAETCGHHGRHVDALVALTESAERASRRPLPINATGAVSAVLLELGIPWQLHRGFALISRTAGLVAHIGEEVEAPITPALRAVIRESESD